MAASSILSPFADILPVMVTMPGPRPALEPLGGVLFVVHILLVNIVIGLAVIAFVQSFAGKDCFYGKLMPKTLAIAVNFGVACLLFVQVMFNSFSYPSYIMMGLVWLSLPFIVLLAYYGLYIFDSNNGATGGPKSNMTRPVILVTVLLLLCTAYILTLNNTLMSRPDKWLEAYTKAPGGTFWTVGVPTLLPRYLHNIAASVAVGGLVMAWLAARKGKKSGTMPAEYADGLKWYMCATLVQAAVGVWYLFSHDTPVVNALLGGTVLGTALLVLGAGAGLAAIVASFRRRLGLTTVLALAAITVMVGLRYYVRHLLMNPVAVPDVTAYQVGPAFLFVVSLLLVVCVLVYMFKTAAPGMGDPGETEGGRKAQ